MSTVLWANVLAGGKVVSDQADHLALHKHAGKLDAITRSLGIARFESVCDTTDLRFNHDEFELPPGVESTDEVMAKDGVWLPIVEAVAMLDALRAHIVDKDVRFGLFGNQHDAVVAELGDVLDFVRAHRASADQFNFSVVM